MSRPILLALVLLSALTATNSARAVPDFSAGNVTVTPFTAVVTVNRIEPGRQFTTADGVVHTRGQVRYGTVDGTPDIVDGETVVVVNADPPRIWGTTVHTTPNVTWRGVFEGTFGITPINFSRGIGIAWGTDGSLMFTRFDGALREGFIVGGFSGGR